MAGLARRKTDAAAVPDAMFHALERAETVAEVKDILDFAEAARTYARQAKLGIEQENRAAELSLRAQRKAGQILVETRRGNAGRPKKGAIGGP